MPLVAQHRVCLGLLLGIAAALLCACTGGQLSDLSEATAPQPQLQPQADATPTAIGAGQIRIGLILPLSASGNAGLAAQSMKNAAEMALAGSPGTELEFAL